MINVVMIDFLKKIKYYVLTRIILQKELKYICRELGSFFLINNRRKHRAYIIMQSHIIEKGLSLKNVRPGFGVPKILSLVSSSITYFRIYKDPELFYFITSILKSYIDFQKKCNIENKDIIDGYNKLLGLHELDESFSYLNGGIKKVRKQDIMNNISINYSSFIKSRHSIRNFTGNKIDPLLIEKALELAENTPSACNRQPWNVYVFYKEKNIHDILDIQGGARQFKEGISCLILITSSCNYFFSNEYHQPYVNGGLYSMNLLLALHSVGLGTIPLNMGISSEKVNAIFRLSNIPDSEIPIMLIGVGEMLEEFHVADSKKFSYKSYTQFDIKK